MLGFRRFFAFSLAVILLLWEGSLLSAQETESLTLTGVVKQVLVAHPLTQASQARIQTASGMTRQAGAYANPTFAFELNDPSRERTYGLKQPLEWPFKRTYRIDIAKADEHLVESEQRGIRQDLIAVARCGLTMGRLKTLVTTAFFGAPVAQVYEAGKVFNLVVRFADRW